MVMIQMESAMFLVTSIICLRLSSLSFYGEIRITIKSEKLILFGSGINLVENIYHYMFGSAI